MRRHAVLCAAVALLAASGAATASDLTYRNDRYGTSATFPSEQFPDALPAPTSGDGMGWTSPDGAQIFIYARPRAKGETPRSVIADRAADDRATYSKYGRRWAVVSGYRDGLIFYERYIFRGDLVHSVSIRYPESARGTYDRLVGPITNSLRGPSR